MPENCVHHWKIETPNGRFSQGKCTPCGETKLFDNYLANDRIREIRLETFEGDQKSATMLVGLNLRLDNVNHQD